MLKLGIFTKPIHIEKIVNFLNQNTNIEYIISTDKRELYHCYKFDVGVSYCFGSMIDISKTCTDLWYNYHPAPLPMFKGADVYANAVGKKVKDWSVSLHKMTMELDSGELIDKMCFDLLSVPVSSNEIGSISHYYLFQLFKKSIGCLVEPVVFGTCDGLEEVINEKHKVK